VENERESKGNYMALEPENYLLLDAIHKKKRRRGSHWSGDPKKMATI